MKGIIFTEFAEMVEAKFGPDLLDEIIDASDLPSGGAYTTVGTYDHKEIVSLVMNLSESTGTPVPDLLRAFGEYLFGRFVILYPAFFEGGGDAFSFLEGVEQVIHPEVRKLYPNAELPRFESSRPDESSLVLVYRSSRHLEDVAQGLIQGCLLHYGDPAEVSRSGDDSEADGIVFTLRRPEGAA